MEELIRESPWLIPILAVMGWSVVLSMIARVSGWSELAEHYAALDSYEGPKRQFQTISMERWKVFPSNYGGVVEFGADARGLHLSLFVLFRPFHPPLVIPWADIISQKREVLLWKQTALVAARAPGVTIVIQDSAAAWIAAQSGGLFNVPAASFAPAQTSGRIG